MQIFKLTFLPFAKSQSPTFTFSCKSVKIVGKCYLLLPIVSSKNLVNRSLCLLASLFCCNAVKITPGNSIYEKISSTMCYNTKKHLVFLSSILHTGPLNSVFCQELSLRQHAMQIKCTNLVWLRKTHAIFLHAASVLHIRPSALLARFF